MLDQADAHDRDFRDSEEELQVVFFSTKTFAGRCLFPFNYPRKIEWDLTTGPLSKVLELLDTQV